MKINIKTVGIIIALAIIATVGIVLMKGSCNCKGQEGCGCEKKKEPTLAPGPKKLIVENEEEMIIDPSLEGISGEEMIEDPITEENSAKE